MVLETLVAFTSGAGASQTPTFATGQSATIRDTPGKKAMLLNLWGDFQAASTLVIRSSEMHDSSTGITVECPATTPLPLLPWACKQILKSQDTLTFIADGTGAGQIDNLCATVFYPDMPGANLITYAQYMGRKTGQLMVGQNTITAGAGGGITGAENINVEVDRWAANRDYALLGAVVVTSRCAAILYNGQATGNKQVGLPGNLVNPHITANWFVALAQMTGEAVIPVVNAADRNNFQIACAQNQAAAAPLVHTHFELLQ